jgi:hypothetical protein
MSSFLNKDNSIGLLLIMAGACSIGVGGWQYREDGKNIQINGDDLCDSVPFAYARRKSHNHSNFFKIFPPSTA